MLAKSEKYVRKLLSEKLPRGIYYHSLEHTLEVVQATEEICNRCGVSSNDKELVMLAAWFHDTGFSRKYDRHEEESMDIAEKFLGEQISPAQIAKIKSCIYATKFGVTPEGLLPSILSDADFYHLSTDKYFDKLDLLRREWKEMLGIEFSDSQWYHQNKHFLEEQHQYYTSYGKEVLAKRKQKNIISNERLLSSIGE